MATSKIVSSADTTTAADSDATAATAVRLSPASRLHGKRSKLSLRVRILAVAFSSRRTTGAATGSLRYSGNAAAAPPNLSSWPLRRYAFQYDLRIGRPPP